MKQQYIYLIISIISFLIGAVTHFLLYRKRVKALHGLQDINVQIHGKCLRDVSKIKEALKIIDLPNKPKRKVKKMLKEITGSVD